MSPLTIRFPIYAPSFPLPLFTILCLLRQHKRNKLSIFISVRIPGLFYPSNRQFQEGEFISRYLLRNRE